MATIPGPGGLILRLPMRRSPDLASCDILTIPVVQDGRVHAASRKRYGMKKHHRPY